MLEKGINLEQIAVFVDVNPRSVFELFDEYEIIIEILHDDDHGFAFRIDQYTEMDSETRKDAEFDAFKEALKMLEKKLENK